MAVSGAKGINTNASLNFFHPLDAHLPLVEIMQPQDRGEKPFFSAGLRSCTHWISL